jgi:hypothetical protein
MPTLPVRGSDNNVYQLDYATGPGGGLSPTVQVEADQIGQGGGTSSGTSQQLVAANASRYKIDISNGGDTDVWLTFHASAAAVAGQGRLLPAHSQGTYYTRSRVAYINAASGSNVAVGYTEF